MIGLLGLGTVGQGVYDILYSRNKEINQLVRKKIKVKKILIKDIHKERDKNVPRNLLTLDAEEILNDDDIDIVVEAIGGTEEAYELIKRALKSKKHVVSANKAVISKYLKEFLELAEKNNVKLLFEGSVGGGTPITKPLVEISRVNNITRIVGILNGTSNYILCNMMEKGSSFEAALKKAQELGYAEVDSTDDIEGIDVLRKIVILSSLAYKGHIDENKIIPRGISNIKDNDIKIFKELNLIPKLIATSVKEDEVSISVEPVLINKYSSFASVNDSYNMISLFGDYIGELKFYGQGAGKYPTGNALVSDILDIVTNSYPKVNPIKEKCTTTSKGFNGNYYIRLHRDDINNFDNIDYEVLGKDDSYVYIQTKKLNYEIIEERLSYINNNDYFCSRILTN